MEKYTKAYYINLVLAFLYAVAGFGMVWWSYRHNHEVLASLYGPAAGLLALCYLHYLTARGCRTRQPWARFVSVLMGFVLLVAFPIGTILGGLLIHTCWEQWVERREHTGAARGAWPKDAVRDRPRVTGQK